MVTKISQTFQIKYGNQNITNFPDKVWQPKFSQTIQVKYGSQNITKYPDKVWQPKYHKLSG